MALLVAAVVVATLVYLVASSDERANFIKEVRHTAQPQLIFRLHLVFSHFASISQVRTFDTEIVENAELIMRDFSSVLQSLSTTMTSNALSGNQTWPNVTIPYFHIRAHGCSLGGRH